MGRLEEILRTTAAELAADARELEARLEANARARALITTLQESSAAPPEGQAEGGPVPRCPPHTTRAPRPAPPTAHPPDSLREAILRVLRAHRGRWLTPQTITDQVAGTYRPARPTKHLGPAVAHLLRRLRGGEHPYPGLEHRGARRGLAYRLRPDGSD